MEHTGAEVKSCWHCGAPVHSVQRMCLTCGASAECRPQEFSPIALEGILGHYRLLAAPSGSGIGLPFIAQSEREPVGLLAVA